MKNNGTKIGKNLSKTKSALLLKWKTGKTRSEIIPLRNETNNIPLSFSQKRLWYLEKLFPNNPVYNMYFAYRLTGEFDASILEESLNFLVQRHEILHTSFVLHNEIPVQRIKPILKLKLQKVDLRKIEKKEQHKKIEQLLQKEAKFIFDLESGHLLRLSLFNLNNQEAILFFNIHHIIADGWSLGIIIKEFTSIYHSLIAKEPLNLSKLPIQYADFSIWQEDFFKGKKLAKELNYWRQHLNGDLPVLKLPTDFKKSSVPSYKGSRYYIKIPCPLTEAMNKLARDNHATLFVVLLAAFRTLLYRYTWQADIIIGTPIANRNRRELETLIGLFVNTLALRVILDEDLTFIDLIQKEREIAFGAYAHQNLPFERLIQELHPNRDLTNSPIFNVVFVLQNMSLPEFKLPKVGISQINIHNDTTKFDLLLTLMETPEGLKGAFEYDSSIFLPETIVNFANSFLQLLSEIDKNPKLKICQYELLTKTELKEIVKRCYPKRNIAADICLHQLFEKQTKETPDVIAVIFESARVSYSELNKQANRLANYLRKSGVKRNSLVGLMLDNSFNTIMCILAILKAGGAYVPIEPSYPKERLLYILHDTKIKILITQEKLLDKTTNYKNQVICIDFQNNLFHEEDTGNLTHQCCPEDLAYVIYTSGSTGKSKGMLIQHNNVVRLFRVTEKLFDFSSGDVWTLFHSAAFDFSVWEIWGALLYGGKLVIVPDLIKKSPDLFSELLVTKQVTILNQTPSAFRQLLQNSNILDFHKKMALRFIIFGGEVLDLNMLKSWFETYRENFPRLVNMYGVTETTVHVTYREINNKDIFQSTGSMIGSPLEDLGIFILDAKLRPVPSNAIGEIYVCGNGLGRSYLNREKLTSEHFIYHIFENKGIRLYKTGDLARYLTNGDIEYMGRIDHQVKIRGFRIELGEIETQIRKFPAVDDAVVTINKNISGDKKLVAYVTLKYDKITLQLYQKLQTSQWQTVFNNYYIDEGKVDDPCFNITGWVSSYTNQPIPPVEMLEWVKNTASKILKLHPKKVLEIGCGTGLLLSCIAPQCKEYYGTDFSEVALDYVKKNILDNKSLNLSNVRLKRCAANDLSEIAVNKYDCAMINSVVQYFPAVEYLLEVLEQVINKVSLYGCIFLGDIRSLPMQKMFHSSVELFRAPSDINIKTLKESIKLAIEKDKALLIDPTFFYTLKQKFPRISKVGIYYKESSYDNEMSLFRYDVVLYLDKNQTKKPVKKFHWNLDKLSTETIPNILKDFPGIIVITDIPNEKITNYESILSYIDNSDGDETIIKLKEFAKDNEKKYSIMPETFWKLEKKLPYIIEIIVDVQNATKFTVIFFPKADSNLKDPYVLPAPSGITISQVWGNYTNRSLRNNYFDKIVPDLRKFLKRDLPDYMVPSFFILLNQIPVTANGKTDYKSLPPVTYARPKLSTEFVKPRTPVEKKLIQTFSEILNLQQVGINDDFFELGGHSLLAAQLMFKLQKVFRINLPLRLILQMPTVAKLSEAVESLLNNAGSGIKVENKVINLPNEVVFNENMKLCDSGILFDPNNCNVFLTGVTGFIGSFLLKELLETTNNIIYCLVRADNDLEAMARIKKSLSGYMLWSDKYFTRIKTIVGDLAKPNFGLTDEKYLELASLIKIIYHSGAFVNFVYPYSALKPSNVNGTKEILRFATHKSLKKVEYISTLYVFSKEDSQEYKLIEEKNIPKYWGYLKLGYTQSKWVAEQIVGKGRDCGIPINIYRLGRITGDSKTGACQLNDFFWSMIKLCLATRSIPTLNNSIIDIVPVDVVCQSIVELSKNTQCKNSNFHLCNPNPISFGVFCDFLEKYGYTFKVKNYTEWLQDIQGNVEELKKDSQSLLPLLSLLDKEMQMNFGAKFTYSELNKLNIYCPPVSEKLLGIYFNYFIEIGYFDSPSK